MKQAKLLRLMLAVTQNLLNSQGHLFSSNMGNEQKRDFDRIAFKDTARKRYENECLTATNSKQTKKYDPKEFKSCNLKF